MLFVVLAVAVLGLAVLVAAILTGNTILALIVIALAALGLLLLARDWFRQRRRPDEAPSTEEAPVQPQEHPPPPEPEGVKEKRALRPDLFEPDVYEDAEQINDD